MLKEEKTIGQVASDFEIHPSQATKWKRRFLDRMELIFTDGVKNELAERDKLIEQLYAQIGQLKVELDFLKKKMGVIG